MEKITRVLLLAFHPRLEASHVNRFLLNTLREHPHIEVKDMYELYPDFNIDVNKEQQDLLQADLVIVQHPFFWYAAPPLIKQWIDLVLEHGWAYGTNGDKLKGKQIMHLVSSGGGFEDYCQQGKNLYTYTELLRPFELTYKFCQMQQLPTYVVPLANKIAQIDLEQHAQQVKRILEQWIAGEVDAKLPAGVTYLNELN
ncbi:NAD(P)H-dependent oxidoreductase [Sphingobacterium griseoflavum]|uniref:Flavodoxin-like fold domain-containing protein n=1 Tax=Sphingobacterium griseoflavum TaxID=1474952 RepID=A0ABQ3HY81_9SPHI|nr:NAD(P)H-dependent oxidoreductase [Sphingobacterium griseoflavum]GHE32030.1 hypothetical protein GCM10017764_14000 [Sphingobacterium griseoflavum]